MKKRNRILIIDDEEELCLLLKRYFLRRNYEVFVAHTIREGLSSLETLEPDAVFLDSNLPDGTGWEIAPQLATKYPQMNFLLMSAYNNTFPAMPLKARYTIVEKPFSCSGLDKKLADLCA